MSGTDADIGSVVCKGHNSPTSNVASVSQPLIASFQCGPLLSAENELGEVTIENARAKLLEDKKKAEKCKAMKKKEEEAKKEHLKQVEETKGTETREGKDLMETETPMQEWKRRREVQPLRSKEENKSKPADLTKTPTSKKNRPNGSAPKNNLDTNAPAAMDIDPIDLPPKPECKDFLKE